jgi:hypothetical protein
MSEESRLRSSTELKNPASCQRHNVAACNRPIPASSSAPLNQASITAIEALEFLHRGDESIVTLHRKCRNVWEELGGIHLRNLRERFP